LPAVQLQPQRACGRGGAEAVSRGVPSPGRRRVSGVRTRSPSPLTGARGAIAGAGRTGPARSGSYDREWLWIDARGGSAAGWAGFRVGAVAVDSTPRMDRRAQLRVGEGPGRALGADRRGRSIDGRSSAESSASVHGDLVRAEGLAGRAADAGP